MAYNLGWKLGLAPTGRASAAVLDSYHFERHRAGKDMLVLNEYLHRVELGGESDLPLTEAVRRRLAVILGGQDVVQQRMRRAVAELDINYRHSPIVSQHRHRAPLPGEEPHASRGGHDFGAAPHAGDRASDGRLRRQPGGEPIRLLQVLQGTGHHLVLFPGEAPSDETIRRLGDAAEAAARGHGRHTAVHWIFAHEAPSPWAPGAADVLIDPDGELHRRYGASREGLYLMRPDGYVGFRSQPADVSALRAYLDRLFVE